MSTTDLRDRLLAVAGGLGIALGPASFADMSRALECEVISLPLNRSLPFPDTIVAWRANPPRQLASRLASVRDAASELFGQATAGESNQAPDACSRPSAAHALRQGRSLRGSPSRSVARSVQATTEAAAFGLLRRLTAAEAEAMSMRPPRCTPIGRHPSVLGPYYVVHGVLLGSGGFCGSKTWSSKPLQEPRAGSARKPSLRRKVHPNE